MFNSLKEVGHPSKYKAVPESQECNRHRQGRTQASAKLTLGKLLIPRECESSARIRADTFFSIFALLLQQYTWGVIGFSNFRRRHFPPPPVPVAPRITCVQGVRYQTTPFPPAAPRFASNTLWPNALNFQTHGGLQNLQEKPPGRWASAKRNARLTRSAGSATQCRSTRTRQRHC